MLKDFRIVVKKKILCKNPFYKYLLSMGRTRKRILIIGKGTWKRKKAVFFFKREIIISDSLFEGIFILKK